MPSSGGELHSQAIPGRLSPTHGNSWVSPAPLRNSPGHGHRNHSWLSEVDLGILKKSTHDIYIYIYPGLPSTLQTKDVDITTFSQCMFYSFSGKITFSQSLIRFAEAALRLAGSALAASHIISPMILHGRLDPIS